ncbi:MAG: hypothetical protein AAF560_02725 [Acidobacteriota bacterium]
MQATKPFHSVNNIPSGATLTVTASNISGNVQADAHFMPGAEPVDEVDWTLQQMEAGTAQTPLPGPGISIARVRVAMAQGSQARFDMVIKHNGTQIRRKFWELAADSNTTARIGLVIDVVGGQ